jgi:hypothetical protein
MNIPVSFYLKRRKWTVELVSEDMIIDGVNCRGHCDPDMRLIEIRDNLSSKVMVETFVHEFLHAVEHEYNLKIAHKLIYVLEKPLAYMVRLLLESNLEAEAA